MRPTTLPLQAIAAATAVAAWVLVPWYGAVGSVALLAAWMAWTRPGRQAWSVTRLGIATIGHRIGSSLVILIGIAGVVAVLVALLAMGAGLSATLASGGRDDTALVLRGGSVSEVQSALNREQIDVIEQAPGIARDASGQPVASAELVVGVNLPLRGSQKEASAQLRGVDAAAWSLRPDIVMVQGRKFVPGTRELTVGESAQRQFAGLAVGSDVKVGLQNWTVVGVFRGDGAWNSELWADRLTLAAEFWRGDSAQAVMVKLTHPAAFKSFKAALGADPRLNVEVDTTSDYYDRQSAGFVKIIRIIGAMIGTIMALGALFGAINCMFAAVSSRSREIATLRAIGFGGTPVIVSIMLETMLLALAGGALGGLVAWAFFDGRAAATLNGFSQVMYAFRVSPGVIWIGLKVALAIGFAGGVLPALRAARLPVTAVLRSS